MTNLMIVSFFIFLLIKNNREGEKKEEKE